VVHLLNVYIKWDEVDKEWVISEYGITEDSVSTQKTFKTWSDVNNYGTYEVVEYRLYSPFMAVTR
jgi:hypothetical protein